MKPIFRALCEKFDNREVPFFAYKISYKAKKISNDIKWFCGSKSSSKNSKQNPAKWYTLFCFSFSITFNAYTMLDHEILV